MVLDLSGGTVEAVKVTAEETIGVVAFSVHTRFFGSHSLFRFTLAFSVLRVAR